MTTNSETQPEQRVETTPEIAAAAPRFPIVGIGASAGGLEALDQFFRALPPDSGLAFVVVQHLDPSHASLLSEILQRGTTMPVLEAEDQMPVAANRVLIIPPNRDMAIFHGTLQLSEPSVPRGQRLPIDAFFRSLAEDQGVLAVGIILSGTGTDGTEGLRAILGAGGVTLVQEPGTAKYDGMQSSAIQAGYASQVLAVDKMPDALIAGARKLLESSAYQAALLSDFAPAASPSLLPSLLPTLMATPPPPLPLSPAWLAGLNRLLLLLRSATGHDFSLYKKSTISRRIERRMLQHDLTDIEVYVRFLKQYPAELQVLFKELLINVTSFFRDPEAFVALKQEILPPLLKDLPEDSVFRVWVAGCASGEEAYSIAILLREWLHDSGQPLKIQIYATDLDDEAIATARVGLYPPNIAADLTPERLRRFFNKEEAGYRVKKEVREMIVFALQNVIKDPPFTKLDLLSCRNLMIYLEPELQNRLIPAFHYALKPGGVLFLSSSESIGNHTQLFTALNRKWKFYRAVHSAAANHALLASELAWTAAPSGKAALPVTAVAREVNLAELAKRALLQAYAPASVVTDGQGNILYVHGETGKYLRPAPGQASLNLVDMAREGLPLELRNALQTAASQGTPTIGRELAVKTNGDFQSISLSVRPLADAPRRGLLLVSFQDLASVVSRTAPSASAADPLPVAQAEISRVEALERDLAYTRENLQATVEAQQASNEELKSGNEELQSTNEELQSTNEELETSKEELQSLNEELITVNAELQSKIEQLAGMQNDMKNLFDNIHIGTLFLDRHLLIRRFTREATQVYRLAGTDIGRPLADIKSYLEGEDLLLTAQSVLETLVPWEGERRTSSGTWYLARIQPYRTLDNMIDGVVLTFTDITGCLAAVAAQVARDLAEAIVDSVREPLVVLDADLQIVSASRAFYRSFLTLPENTVGRKIYDLGDGQWNIPALRELLENILPHNQTFDDYRVEHDFPSSGPRKLLLNARRIVGKHGSTPLILLSMQEES